MVQSTSVNDWNSILDLILKSCIPICILFFKIILRTPPLDSVVLLKCFFVDLQRLILKFLSFCDDVGDVWFQLFEILDRIIRGDYEHCVLLSYLPYFRAWLSKTDLATAVRIADYFKRNLNFFLQDKVSNLFSPFWFS